MRLTLDDDRRTIWTELQRREHARRVANFNDACHLLYQERMVRTSNPATVKLSTADAAEARRVIADVITRECDDEVRFNPLRAGGRR